jgi:hypothetical protein
MEFKIMRKQVPVIAFDIRTAQEIGLNEAIALQRLHQALGQVQDERDGRRWVARTSQEWQKRDFPFWSVKTINRAFKRLEDTGMIETAVHNDHHMNRTKSYTINYERVVANDLSLVNI